ncbi:MAG TPA: 23S rRNA (pseudouridine(1915)-N(3))-methyltransferase RlmH [Lachnospiraceae bacterium]|jgi:23S rRNA (pseudouridine1915-N3)-methyltransferase|nr:23S rRNA (pseudouridine(1915)-N(3))-methyltransferase RlmH [Lachnospiraceae bacterium]
MNITIISVGKIKEAFYRDAVSEYAKRLSKYCKFTVIEVPDEKTPDKSSEALNEQIKKKEADAILRFARDDAYVMTLEINGTRMNSEQFADKIESLSINGVSHIMFVIGGSLGLHESVTKKADFHLSFSDMTFPHQLMRVILTEQIYRGFRIIQNEPYHK